MRKIHLAAFLLLFKTLGFSQFSLPLDRNYNSFIESTVEEQSSFHSGIKPYNINDISQDSTYIQKENSCFQFPSDSIHFLPLFDAETQLSKNVKSSYNAQVGVQSYFRLHKDLSIQVAVLGNVQQSQSSFIDHFDSTIIPFWGRPLYKDGNTTISPIITGLICYSPSKYLSISAGNDKNFIGNGYRSLLLSDNAAPYPFLKLSVQFWRLKYLAMWAYLADVDVNRANSAFHDKYGSFHYLSVNLTNRLSFGFFESIISWAKDTSTNRGMEWNYLNPIIFYRPVEYAIHSPDNALMGGDVKLRLWKKTFLYAQLMLDDLMMKELLKNSGWWGNKYGIQLGFKCYNLFNVPFLFLQTEFNSVRPYMYSHSTPLLHYSSNYLPLAHPLGSNFSELLTIVRFSRNKWTFSATCSFVKTGLDTAASNFGQNIFKTSLKRVASYGVSIGQGDEANIIRANIGLNYTLKPEWNLQIFGTAGLSNNMGEEYNSILNPFFSIGIKTLLYNQEKDW